MMIKAYRKINKCLLLSTSSLALCLALGTVWAAQNQVQNDIQQALTNNNPTNNPSNTASSNNTANNNNNTGLTQAWHNFQSTVHNANNNGVTAQNQQTQANAAQQNQQANQQNLGQQNSQQQQAQVNNNNQANINAANNLFAANTGMSAEPSKQDVLREAAFQSLLKDLMPLSPDQVVALRKAFNQSQKASVTWPGTPPKPIASSLQVNLATGTPPPAIRLQAGFVSSLVFVDSTGQPWPIRGYDLGNPNAFNIQWDQKSNILMVQPLSLYNYANIVVQLQGLATPVTLMLVPGGKVVDYRMDIRVPGLGPDANMANLGDSLPGSADTQLLSLLDGIPPTGAKNLKVDASNLQAWLSHNRLYVRTRMNILSPGWLATMSSADGMHAYQMLKTPSLLVSNHGKLGQVKIEGY